MACIGGWYLFSSLLSIFNKNLFGRDQYHFDFPLLVTTLHAAIQWLVSSVLVHLAGRFWLTTAQREHLRSQSLTWRKWALNVAPCGSSTGLEIAMANSALMFITLSFYTFVKSSTPIWVLTFAFLFRIETFTWRLLGQIALICLGVALTIVGETKFHAVGFCLVLGASVASGFRWCITQILLKKADLGLDHPILTMYRLAPVMFVTMALLTLLLEDPWNRLAMSPALTVGDSIDGGSRGDPMYRTVEILSLAVGGGFVALGAIVCEFRLIQLTSTVTLSVCGIAKEILMIVLSVVIYGDVMTPVNTLGLFISIAGIMYYNYDRWTTLNRARLAAAYSVLPPSTAPIPITGLPVQRLSTAP
ncbi:hypothetical protein IWQ60_001265 [Tieghemiomyces parasiticus]|uniref:Sugar phosphate transporter domain-containing protein n=1 Tax=Tieghemiomyces parasiticus TaxID=78921 RepID=A0A9W8DYG9_9FUNG|nr:hypothetical protein IWQ60_001265 [Tieghemiomyces parasiticus]